MSHISHVRTHPIARQQRTKPCAFVALLAALAATLLTAPALQAKTLVYCSEGSPENFSPAINTTGTSFDAARPVYD